MSRGREERVWFENVRDLFNYPKRFWPTRDMTLASQVNALVRAILYSTLVIYAYNRSDRVLLFGMALITLASLGYNGSPFPRSLASLAPTRCRKPTAQNPFMNVLVNEYGSESVDPPCDFRDVQDEARKHFNKGLFRNIEDVYEKQNSQREFIPMPNGGLPPDSKEFANFLYGNMRNCKTFASDCVVAP